MSELVNGGSKSAGEREDRNVNEVNTIGDRRNIFIIDGGADKWPGFFHDTKTITGSRKITAVPIREHGTDKFNYVLRFLFDVPQELGQYLNVWTAVPRPNVYTN